MRRADATPFETDMGRTILAILFLLALAATLWYGARWLAGSDDLEVTILFQEAESLSAGSPVVAKSVVIGRVTAVSPLQGRDAVSVTIDGRHRDEVLVDSRFSIDDGLIRVSSTLAFGRPVEDGEVLYARDSKIARWLGEKGEPAVRRIREEAARLLDRDDVQRRLDEWASELPDWETAGDEVVRKNLEEIGEAVERVERDLRAKGRDLDAERVRRDFDAWVERMKSKWKNGDATPDESATETVR